MALRGRMGAYRRWANEPDPTAATAPARAAFLSKFELDVDPTGSLSPDERARRAGFARKAHFAGLARQSALARAVRAAKKAATPAKVTAREVAGAESTATTTG